jgi:hypothetical protein
MHLHLGHADRCRTACTQLINAQPRAPAPHNQHLPIEQESPTHLNHSTGLNSQPCARLSTRASAGTWSNSMNSPLASFLWSLTGGRLPAAHDALTCSASVASFSAVQ